MTMLQLLPMFALLLLHHCLLQPSILVKATALYKVRKGTNLSVGVMANKEPCKVAKLRERPHNFATLQPCNL